MSTWNASRISETTSWTQPSNWGGRLSDKEYRKRRKSWNPFIGVEEPDILQSGDYEAIKEGDRNSDFIRENSNTIRLFDKIADHIEPEDDFVERIFEEELRQQKKVASILDQIQKRKSDCNSGKSLTKRISRRRCKSFVSLLKQVYRFRCQVCAVRLPCPNLETPGYTEGHHIKPIGDHDGPDIAENVIIVCPNHHILLEHGGMRLDLNSLQILEHTIGREFVDFHNTVISAA